MTHHDRTFHDPDLEADLDRLFDRELSRQERAALEPRLARNPEAAKRFRETTRVILALREPIEDGEIPDFASAAIENAPIQIRRRPQSAFSTSRLAIAASLIGLGAAGAILLTESQPESNEPIQRAHRTDPSLELLSDPDLAARELAAIAAQPSPIVPAMPRTTLADSRTFDIAPRFGADDTAPVYAARLSTEPLEFKLSSAAINSFDHNLSDLSLSPFARDSFAPLRIPTLSNVRVAPIPDSDSLFLIPDDEYDWYRFLWRAPAVPRSLDLGRPASNNDAGAHQ